MFRELGLVALLLCTTQTVDAIKCFECIDSASSPDPACNDPFNLTSSTAAASNKTNDCVYGCMKFDDGSLKTTLGSSDWRVKRGCYIPSDDPWPRSNNYDPYGAGKREGCRGKYDRTEGTLRAKGERACFCQKDFCNESGRAGISLTTLILAITCVLGNIRK